MRSECVGIGIALLMSSATAAFADPAAPAPGAASAPPPDPAAQYPAQPGPGAQYPANAPSYPPAGGGQGYPQQVPAYPSGYPMYAPYPPPPPPEPTVRTANNALYVEGLGQGIFYSINYDRAFGDFSARVGLGYVAVTEHNELVTDCSVDTACSPTRVSSTTSLLTIPLSVSYLGIGSKKHMFEVGAGMTIAHASAGASILFVDDASQGPSTTVLGSLILGYRLQPPNGGFFLRAGLSPLISRYGFWPWPYFGIGATL
jgi:hypothetical protein